MSMCSSHNPEFAIVSSDLDAVIDMLSDQALLADSDLHIRDLIMQDLMNLPSTDIGSFSITCLCRFTCDDPELGSGSEWVSIDVDDAGMNFSIGNHIYTPGVGGDTSSETIFQCSRDGDKEGHLCDWLSQLEALDRDLMKISVNHEFQVDEFEADQERTLLKEETTSNTAPLTSAVPLTATERDKLLQALRSAATNERLSPELRQSARRNYRNLLAIANRRRIVAGETGGLDGQLIMLGIDRTIFHIQGGLRSFANVTRAVAADLDISLSELRPLLRGWYNGARDVLEDAGENIDNMDGPEAVKGALSMIKKLDYRE